VRRVTAGRAVLTGYGDSWRWRLGGGVGAVRDHREWWSALVSAVAYAPATPIASPALDSSSTSPAEPDAAPVAHLIDALGPPSAHTAFVSAMPAWWREPAPRWLPVLLFFFLLAEWGSRRLRGVR
jgi:hypothetical protein